MRRLLTIGFSLGSGRGFPQASYGNSDARAEALEISRLALVVGMGVMVVEICSVVLRGA
jgi:hypothetical protein